METLLDSEILKRYEEETNEYIRKKKVEKLFDVILKNVLINKPENLFIYIYNNIYSFLLNKIFIIGPPLLKITSILSSAIAKTFNYYHVSTHELIKSHILYDINNEENSSNKKLINDDLVSSFVKSTLNNLDAKKKRGYVVEGFPCTNLQANECLKHLPSHVFVLFADEEYIYEKYEEENNINIFSSINNIFEDLELFEVKEIDPTLLKDKVKVYLRNVSEVVEVLENNKEVINLRDYSERNLIDHVTGLVRQNKDEWNCVLDDSFDTKEKN